MAFVRILALDVGDVRIGVAISDPLGIVATPMEILSAIDAIDNIIKIIKEKKVTKLLYGVPFREDGTSSKQAEKVQLFMDTFKKRVQEEEIELEYLPTDERYTSKMAKEHFISNRKGKAKDKNIEKKLDSIAASILLQEYLHSVQYKKGK